MDETKLPELLPLDLPERVVVLNTPEGVRRHIFRRITNSDAAAYSSGKMLESHRQGQNVEDRIKITGPEIQLYDRAIARVEGYPGTSDGRAFMELPNWKDRVRGARIAAVRVLMEVRKAAPAADCLIDPDYDVVSLDAYWNAPSGGGNLRYQGLLHRFTPPKQGHWDRVGDFRTSTVAVGGSRTARKITRYPNMHGTMAELYDELIASVDGYSVGGSPVCDRKAILEYMDPFHKVTAVAALFETPDVEDETGE